MKTTLFTNKAINGDSDPVTWPGGGAYFDLNGVVDGATITISVNIGNGYNTNLPELAITELGLYNDMSFPSGALIKATLSDAGAGTSLTLIIMS